MEDNKNHSKKQQFPRQRHNAAKITNTTKNTQNKEQSNKHKNEQKWAVFIH